MSMGWFSSTKSGVAAPAATNDQPSHLNNTTATTTTVSASEQPKPQQGMKRKRSTSIVRLIDRIVDINVGSGEGSRTFKDHRGKLCARSAYFKAAFRQDEGKTSFDFPTEDPEVYERVENWIYGEGFLFEEELNQPGKAKNAHVKTSDDTRCEILAAAKLTYGTMDLDGNKNHAAAFEMAGSETGLDDTDNDQAAQAPQDFRTQNHSPSPLETLTLSKIWVFANLLKIDKLCNEIIELLGQRLGYDMQTPVDALNYTFDRCDANDPLLRLLVEFTVRSAPVTDALEDPSFKTAHPDLLRMLLKEMVTVRGNNFLDGADWIQQFKHTLVDYKVAKATSD